MQSMTIPMPGEPGKFFSAIQKLDLYQQAVRKIAELLTPHEFRVYMSVIDRTVGWGTSSVFVSSQQLRDGNKAHGGLNLHKDQISRILRKLCELGLITRNTIKRKGSRITVLTVWEDAKVALAIPKRKRADAPSVKVAGRTDAPSATINKTKENKTNLPVAKDATPIRSASEVVEDIKTRPRTKKKKTNLNQIWNDTLAEHHPQGVMLGKWTLVDASIMKKASKRWTGLKVPFPDFMAWAVEHWVPITSVAFRWMKKSPAPRQPSVRFFVRFMETFADVYAGDELNKWMTSRDRTELERLMASGCTREQALYIIAEDAAAGAMRREVDAKLVAAKRAVSASERHLEEAKRLRTQPTFIHPQKPSAPPVKITHELPKYGEKLEWDELPDWEDLEVGQAKR